MRTPSLAKRFPDLVLSGELLLRNPITGIAACCARAASGHAAAPPRSAMNSRRLMPSMGTFSPVIWPVPQSGGRTLSLPQANQQVLGPDLNRSESRSGRYQPLLGATPDHSTLRCAGR